MSMLVYQAINAVTEELSVTGIPKRQRNEQGDYAYRGIEDVLGALAPILARHKLCVLPRVLGREVVGQIPQGDGHVIVIRAAFDLVSAIDASRHVIETFGEAFDDSDKGTAKAMSAAYKAAMLQAFCIPVPQEDADTSSPRNKGRSRNGIAVTEPPEGWESWSAEVIDIAKTCETAEAIDRLLERRRIQLAALQRGRPDLYAKVGEAIEGRLAERERPVKAGASSRKPRRQEGKDVQSQATAAA